MEILAHLFFLLCEAPVIDDERSSWDKHAHTLQNKTKKKKK